MKNLLVMIFLSAFAGESFARSIADLSGKPVPVIFDDVNAQELTRLKRQFNFGPQDFGQRNYGPQGFGQQNFPQQNYGQSSALANANANSNYFGPNGFGSSNSMAGAQSFQSQGPLGGFGASAANSQNQGFQAGPNGITGNAGFSGSQSYNLPGGKTLALSYGSGYNLAPGQMPSITNSNSIAFT